MTQTSAPQATVLLDTIVRASVADPIAQHLQSQADKIARRVDSIQVIVAVDEPFEGGWCYRHRQFLRCEPGKDGLRDHCHHFQSSKTPCLIRPVQLARLSAHATGLPLIDGDAAVVGVLVTDSEGVSTATSFAPDLQVAQYLHYAGHCHHCKTSRDRRYTLLVRSGEDSEVWPIGASCARELTGGAVRDGLMKLMVRLRERLAEICSPSHVHDGAVAPLLEVLALTIRVNEIQGGYVRAAAGTRDRPATRTAVYDALVWTPQTVGPKPLLTVDDLTEQDLAQAQRALEVLADWDDDSDFATNLRRIAASENIEISGKRQRLGMAVCIPDAADRHQLRQARAAQRRAEQPEGALVSEVGIYETETGRVYKVVRGGSGFLYAKVLNKLVGEAQRLTEAGTTINAEYVYEKGAIGQIRAHHRVSVQRAEQLSILFTQCIVCGVRLKAAQSVQRGIGPVCYKRIRGE